MTVYCIYVNKNQYFVAAFLYNNNGLSKLTSLYESVTIDKNQETFAMKRISQVMQSLILLQNKLFKE